LFSGHHILSSYGRKTYSVLDGISRDYAIEPDMKENRLSAKLYERALQHLSGGVSSPVRAFKAVGGKPIYMDRGKGAYIYDVDGNRYLDFCCSWGPLILGHAHPDILKAIKQAALKGTSLGAVHEMEVLLAEKIKDLCPHVELLRFVSSGTEAVMSAVRVARAFTRRNKILKFAGCYHGHADYLLASAGSGLATFGLPSSAGVPDDFTRHTLVAPLGDTEAVERIFRKYGSDIAAVIIEPVPANNGLLIQKKDFLVFLRKTARRNRSLLIFDEVISGFRLAPGGAAEYYGIVPDLSTYGKVVGGGLPVGAFGGRRSVMKLLVPDGPVYQAGTLSGNPLAMAAGLATLQCLQKNNAWSKLAVKSRRFILALSALVSDLPVNITGIGSIFWLHLQAGKAARPEDISRESARKFAILFHQALRKGIYFAPSPYEVGFISTAHSDRDLRAAAGKIAAIIKAIS
jgi:glutamate-1-semialdehyde 2,1-aminomutase